MDTFAIQNLPQLQLDGLENSYQSPSNFTTSRMIDTSIFEASNQNITSLNKEFTKIIKDRAIISHRDPIQVKMK